MNGTPGARTTRVWAALCAVTVLSWRLGTERTAGAAVTVAVLAIALVKARFVVRCFMEVQDAPAWLRRLTDVWLAALWTALVVLYLV
ncbi:cytochrome C oxidase subunit IV family protein [Actinomadura parmotrematis]|uniref:Cytochrome C oxidase subunit IV family protein n=1 Tax=Actinomadura parmotrematis TaxID=2864039 RepID=A0ABS7FSF7_9ACTN|nr:cytochrome C oxidase subunit IV family protein [Actinomadura parmotrematis]MBW8482664.1 cytochrome C oxidase subunit IV family protein [Actinomadura parmotrematis]